MAFSYPLFPNASSMFVHSGNILNWNHLKKKPLQTQQEEFIESVKGTLSSYLEVTNSHYLQGLSKLDCIHAECKETLPKEERTELKLTVKIFLYYNQPATVVKDAVEKVLSELDVEYIETVLLSWHANPQEEDEEEEEELTLEHLKPYWEILQELHHDEVLLNAGVSDLDRALLEELYEWAKVKPCINQVNLASCCTMPPELIEYAKATDIQLLTHNDPKAMFPDLTLQDIIRSYATQLDSENWSMEWAVCYSVVVKCRGVIKAKGNMITANRPSRNNITIPNND
ncbi:glutamate--cysteine ligase regulatory subunit-like [Argonauta hians]